MRTLQIILLLVLFGCDSSTESTKTPKNMINNVISLAEASGILNICFESAEYENVSTEIALELFELDSRLGEIAQRISDHYEGNALFLTYEMARMDTSDNKDMQGYSKKKYGYCSETLLVDVKKYVEESERLFSGE